ncbi:hypothetical protein DWX04_21930 [Phocaeicola vulgatus]|uniref:Uncharacterized protein n=1 Tax=Phocaeicola vulgatus TaxID=821 RepID=A0A412Q847_PHOVU|nr:hypothetical protein DWX04_21930 [Phocaeicola vulgatus]
MFGFIDREMVVIKSFFCSVTLYIIGMVKEKGLGKLLMIISGCRLMKKRVWKITGSDLLVVLSIMSASYNPFCKKH